MKVDLPGAIKLATFTGVTALAAAATHFGVPGGEHVVGWLGTALELGKEGAMALTGHLGVHLLDTTIDERANAEERARGAQNHDLHRLIGEAIARILEREAAGAPGGEFGAKYLVQAAAAFRTEWMTVKLTGAENAVSEPAIPSYFVSDAESIRTAPVLEQAEWISLVEKVAGPATFREYDEALTHAASKLREHFAFELWEAAKDAWKENGLAWPALILRLLSLLLGNAAEAAANSAATIAQLSELRAEVRALSEAIGNVVTKAAANIPPQEFNGQAELRQVIRGYQDRLHSDLRGLDSRIADGFAEIHRRQDLQDEKLTEIMDAVTSERWRGMSPGDQEREEPSRSAVDFSSLLAEHAHLIGRQSARDHIQQFIGTHRSGVLLVKGEMGIGKTALIANLVNLNPGSIHFFYRATSNLSSPDEFSATVLQRLLEKHAMARRELAPDPKQLRRQLEGTLTAVSRRLKPGEKELIFVDALEEAERAFDGATAVDVLPQPLPEGICFIVSSNSRNPDLRVLEGRKDVEVYDMDAASGENRGDAYAYVDAMLDGRFDTGFRHEIADYANWNFLFLHLLCELIQEGRWSADRVRTFLAHVNAPDSRYDPAWKRFETIYDAKWSRLEDMFEQEPGKLEQLARVVAAIATAGVPVTRDQVCTAFVLTAASFDWSLRFIGQYLHTEVAVAGPGQSAGTGSPREMRLYSLDLFASRRYFQNKFSPLKPWHAKWAALLSGWMTLQGWDLEVALRTLHLHLIEAADLDGLSALSGAGYFRRIAAELGDVEARATVSRVAASLARAGDERREALLACAYTYCDFSERIRGAPRAIEGMIRRGDIERVYFAVDSEPDLARRGVLMAAAATLIVEREGLTPRASHLWSVGAGLVNPQLAQGSERLMSFSLPTRQLLRALAAKEGKLGGDRETLSESVRPAEPPAVNNASARSSIPWFDLAVAKLASMKSGTYTLALLGWAFIMAAIAIVAGLDKRYPFLAAAWIFPPMPMFVVWLMSLTSRWALRRWPERADRDAAALARSIELASPTERPLLLSRLVRYEASLATHRNVPLTIYALRRWFRAAADQPRIAAGIVLDVVTMDPAICRVLIGELSGIEPSPLEAIYKEVASQWFRSADNRALLWVLAATSGRLPQAVFLFDFLSRYAWFRRPEDEADVIWALSQAPYAALGRAILASLDRNEGTGSRFWSAVLGFKWNRNLLRMTFGFAPQIGGFGVVYFVVLLILLPAYVAGVAYYMFFGGAIYLIMGPPVGAFLLAGRVPCDFAFPAEVRGESDPVRKRALLAHVLRPLKGFSPRVRRIRDTLLVQNILREELAEVLTYSQSALRRVMKRLVREQLFGSFADTVLRVMGDRNLLDATRSVRPQSGAARESHAPEPSADARQLERVMPLSSLRIGFLWTIAAALVWTILWILTAVAITESPRNRWLFFGAGEFAVMSVAIVALQHLWPKFTRKATEKYAPCRGLLGLTVWAFLIGIELATQAMAHAAGVRIPGIDTRAPIALWLFIVSPVLLTNLIVPEWIDQWRGAGLLYATREQLRRRRVVATSAALLLALVFGVYVKWIA